MFQIPIIRGLLAATLGVGKRPKLLLFRKSFKSRKGTQKIGKLIKVGYVNAKGAVFVVNC